MIVCNNTEQRILRYLYKSLSLLQGHIPTLLRTQYRCHPHISAIANSLFYGGMLTDGVTETDRQPLLVQ